MNRTFSVEEIQDLVENEIMETQAFEVARKYITYRYKRALVRKANSTDEQILSLLLLIPAFTVLGFLLPLALAIIILI